MLGAASTIIREWAESVLEVKFPSLCSLGKYLVNNLCVDNRSLSAVCILSASEKSLSVENKGIYLFIFFFFINFQLFLLTYCLLFQ